MCLALTPVDGGASIAAAYSDGSVAVVDVAGGRLSATLPSAAAAVRSLDATATAGGAGGDAGLWAASDDGLLYLYDTAAGVVAGARRGHRGSVLAVAAAPGGGYVATGGADRVLRVWEGRLGKEVVHVDGGFGAAVWGVAYGGGGGGASPPPPTMGGWRSSTRRGRIWSAAAGRRGGSSRGVARGGGGGVGRPCCRRRPPDGAAGRATATSVARVVGRAHAGRGGACGRPSGHSRGWHPPRVWRFGRGLAAARRGAALVGRVPGATPARTVSVWQTRRVAPLGAAPRRRTPAASTPRGTRVSPRSSARAGGSGTRLLRARPATGRGWEGAKKKKNENGEGGGVVNDGRPLLRPAGWVASAAATAGVAARTRRRRPTTAAAGGDGAGAAARWRRRGRSTL
ncbi:hypothetical protein BU14_0696s0002 [Porphyra umbilicalis]|uniref:Uncharacterized protein n=1 Tax=Porphyra umbilicalis TaxID=2786 RepID=A0A1X6NPZ3_PORUM|nr:hypothetical protein BU14_0696s0002 [Porphyra umbilicalis]|eukprot:OSX70652.1 hypothetical protein BU14_0696s0002 [Porphyra umbilicalis]